ncbi:SDR family NAD(P)-dependent oxidoreductase [Pseudoalteromonas rhizosphaerae]|uniref:SDR family NAD(P)-dependent oxidoreductase n=1 Tax=Pseudoalteromonas rhizosphaerae TaxID=2518973 RepID=A0ABW8L1Q2_9GAMM
MDDKIAQPVAVVTGGNKGLGFETVKQLAMSGYKVILTARNAVAGQNAMQDLISQGVEVDFLPLDICSSTSIDAFILALESRYQRCDILVNNAGVFFDWESPASKVQLQDLTNTMETNVFGTINIIQKLLPLLQRSSLAKVINVSSDLGSVSLAADVDSEYHGVDGIAYRISKAALNMYSVELAKEYAGSQVIVSVVSPGWCQTDMGTSAAPRTATQGAQSIVGVALEASDKFHGKFVLDGQFLAW